MSSHDDFVQIVQGMSSKNLGRLNLSRCSRAERRIINDERVRRSSERKASWSLYPELAGSVDNNLKKPFTFFNVDRLHALKEYDTFVSGVFLCSYRCSRREWSSGKIAISIRLYGDDQYNARIYHQRCRRCGALNRPTLDVETYGERVSYRLNKWSGFNIHHQPPRREQRTPPHDCGNCEACRIGRCPHDADDEEYSECRRYCRSDH